MMKIWLYFKLYCFTIVFPVLFLVQTGFPQEHIRILNWNDFHSRNTHQPQKDENGEYFIGGSAILKGALDFFRNDSLPTFIINAGDDFQGTPISAISRGASQIRLLNIIQPDLFIPGNHDFDYGRGRLDSLLKGARFSVINSNMVDTRNGKTLFTPYQIKKVGNVRIGLLGLMAPYLSRLVLKDNIKNIEVLDPKEVVQKYIAVIEDSIDILVVVSHMGIGMDRELARSVNAIDVIIGGHSHTVMSEPEVLNGVIIFQAGSNGRFLGNLELWVDTQLDTILRHKGGLKSLDSRSFKSDILTKSVVDSLENIVSFDLDIQIAELKTDWFRNGRNENNLGNWITDAFRDYTDADVAFQNSGGIRKYLLKGPVTKRDFWEIAPFGNKIVSFEVSGRELLNIYEFFLSDDGSRLQGSGFKVWFDPQAPQHEKVRILLIDGKNINLKKIYTIVTNYYVFDHFSDQFGFSPGNLEHRHVKIYNKVVREVLIDAAVSQKNIYSNFEGRYKKVDNREP